MPKRQESLFFVAVATAMLLVVLAGFARTFYLVPWLGPAPNRATETVFYVHGVVFTAWMMLLVVQPTLSASGRLHVHRRLGWLGVLIAAGVVWTGFLVGIEAAARPPGHPLAPKTPAFLGVILGGVVMFAVLAAAAVLMRRRAQYHKRLMILATVNLLQAAVVRLPLDLPGSFGAAKTFIYADLFILPLLAWDLYSSRRIHPATLWGGLAIVVSLPIRFWFSETELWLGIANGLTN